MIKFEELVETPEYWLETIQNELYQHVFNYMKGENINQTQLAERLGVTKGYVSQVLNGRFNHSLEKLIELSLAIGVAPDIDFKPIEIYLQEQNKVRTQFASISISVDINNPQFTVIRNNQVNKTLDAISA